jgi:hypothetical protein
MKALRMKALRMKALRMKALRMKALCLTVLVSAVALSTSAQAETFVIDYENREAVDPAEGFEEDCWGESEAEDCPERAAALTAELVESLGKLDMHTDASTVALFEAAIEMNEPRLQAMGLRYFANHRTPPDDLWAKAREFFFGPEPVVGHPSAELLRQSLEDADLELSRLYLEGRPHETHGGELPQGAGETDSWADGRVKDAALDELLAFGADERFPDAERLLMLDRFIPAGFTNPAEEIPVTAFVTGALISDVEEHFRTLFGVDPYPSVESSTERQTALLTELSDLQERVAQGDNSAAKRLQEVVTELTEVQEAATAGSRLGLAAVDASDHVFWLDGTLEDPFAPLPRAVAVGTDTRLEATVIRYFGGQASPSSNPDPNGGAPGEGGAAGDGTGNVSGGRAGAGRGGQTGSGGRPGNAGEAGERGDDVDDDDDDGDSGCGCAVPGRNSAALPLSIALVLALGLVRRRARRR